MMNFELPKPDVPMLRKVVEWVEEQDALPETSRQWMQDEWVMPESERVEALDHPAGCGTAYCVAGWIAAQTVPEMEHNYKVTLDGVEVYTWDVAQRALGISDEQADVLFAATNSASDVRKAAEWITGEKL